MNTGLKNTGESTQGGGLENESPGFLDAFKILLSLIFAGLLIQNLFEYLVLNFSEWAAFAAVVIPFGIVFYYLWKSGSLILSTPYFSTSCLLAIAIGTALGTFIIQNANDYQLVAKYGDSLGKILKLLQLDDVFHSWWYISLFGILLVSLIKTSFTRKPSLPNLGFYIAHLSPVIIVIGFWIDYYYGFKGIIGFEVGEMKNVVRIYEGNTNYVSGSRKLPFSIRLDTFTSERFDPEYKIQVWKRQDSENPVGAGHAPEAAPGNPKLVASMPLIAGKIHHVYGTNINFRLAEFYPNFAFSYDYPLNTDTITPLDPGIMLELVIPSGETLLQLRAKQNSKIMEPHFNAMIEFYWDLPPEIRAEMEATWNNQDTANQNQILFIGSTKEVIYLLDGQVIRKKLERGGYYPHPLNEKFGFRYQFIFPDASKMTAAPGTKNEELLNPVARVEIWNRNGGPAQDVYLYPGRSGKGGIFPIAESAYFLALESFKDMETKFWRSGLTVLGEDGAKINTQTIEVNEPMNYKGYRFYQTDYDESNPKYSGIGVSHEPGLYIIYTGFVLMFAGCLIMFFMRQFFNGQHGLNKHQNA